MTIIKNNVEKLNALIKEGKIKEAFEKYYSENVVIQVNGNPPIAGKEQNRNKEMIFLKEIEKLSSAEINSVTFGGTDDNIAMTEWVKKSVNTNGDKEKSFQINVQHWKDDKVIDEKVYFCGDQKF